MKVKEFIDELQKLDQEKEIWLIYDTFFCWEPLVEVAENRNADDTPSVGG